MAEQDRNCQEVGQILAVLDIEPVLPLWLWAGDRYGGRRA